MQNFQGKTAFITGAGSGIGLGMARTFARNGMNVVLCDIRRDGLEQALSEVNRLGAQAIAVEADVSVREQVEKAAQQAFDAFGKVHIVCSNAGISMHGVPIEKVPSKDWEWVLGVNLYGVIHGFQTFLPHMRAHGEECHIVNTASIGGFRIQPGWDTGPYSMSKYAVVAITEALEQDLAGSNIGVSVLAPAAVNTGIFQSGRARPRSSGPKASNFRICCRKAWRLMSWANACCVPSGTKSSIFSPILGRASCWMSAMHAYRQPLMNVRPGMLNGAWSRRHAEQLAFRIGRII